MPRISACVITKNEENNIGEWLACVRQLASEIVVVDTGSTDRTVELARAGGAEIRHFTWCNDFSAAKNFALDQVTGEWVIFLDADEHFLDRDIPQVRAVIEKYHRDLRVVGLVCRQINIDGDDKNRLLDIAYQMRIFRNLKSLRYEGKVHEVVINHAPEPKKFQLIDMGFYHTGYSRQIIKDKCRRNLAILEERIGERGEQPEDYPYLTDVYMGLEDYERAVRYARLTLQEESGLVGMRAKAHRRLIDGLMALGRDTQEREQAIDAAMQDMPEIPEFLWDKGHILFERKQYAAAERFLREALASREKSNRQQEECMTNVMEAQLPQIYLLLGVISLYKGKQAEAFESFLHALEVYPYDDRVFHYIYRFLRKEKPVDIIAILDRFYDLQQDGEFLLRNLWQNHAGLVYVYYANKLAKDGKKPADYPAFWEAGRYDAAALQAAEKVHRLYRLGIWSCLANPLNEQKGMLQLLLPEDYAKAWEAFRKPEQKLTVLQQEIHDSLYWMKNGYPAGGRKLSGAEAEAQISEAVRLFEQGNHAEAIQSLRQQYVRQPQDALLAYGLATLLRLDGQKQAAIQVLSEAKVMLPEMQELLAELRA